MKIKIVSLIKKQEQNLRGLEEEYLKRIRRFNPCDWVEVRRADIHSEADKAKILKAENERLAPHLKTHSFLVVLDSSEREYNSHELAVWLRTRMDEGQKELVFLIGGPMGISEDCLRQARFKISLSKLTFPHKLARVLLLEALYRSFEILQGSRYHK